MNLELIHPVSLASLLRAPRRMLVIWTQVHTELVPRSQNNPRSRVSGRLHFSACLLSFRVVDPFVFPTQPISGPSVPGVQLKILI